MDALLAHRMFVNNAVVIAGRCGEDRQADRACCSFIQYHARAAREFIDLLADLPVAPSGGYTYLVQTVPGTITARFLLLYR